RMVSADFEPRWQTSKQSFAGVGDGRRDAMQRPRGADDTTAERLGNGLMPEANAEYRDLGVQLADQFETVSRLIGSAGSWREENRRGLQCSHFIDGELVVPYDARLGTKLAQVAGKIVDEAIVVINNQDHRTKSAGTLS